VFYDRIYHNLIVPIFVETPLTRFSTILQIIQTEHISIRLEDN